MLYLFFLCLDSLHVHVYLVVYISVCVSVCVSVHSCMCTGVLCVVVVPLHSGGVGDCHFRHVCLDTFGSQLQFVGELALCQLITKAASISLCAYKSVCMY